MYMRYPCRNSRQSKTATCTFAERLSLPVETIGGNGRALLLVAAISLRDGGGEMNDRKKDQRPPPPVLSADPESGLEQKLKRNPECPDAKADVGSDESMDASDPPSSSQPGSSDEPAPSSSFPE
jgi:hypothetical protein